MSSTCVKDLSVQDLELHYQYPSGQFSHLERACTVDKSPSEASRRARFATFQDPGPISKAYKYLWAVASGDVLFSKATTANILILRDHNRYSQKSLGRNAHINTAPPEYW